MKINEKEAGNVPLFIKKFAKADLFNTPFLVA